MDIDNVRPTTALEDIVKLTNDQLEAISYYDEHYQFISQWFMSNGPRQYLGDKLNRVCRFCSRQRPEVSFGKEAHVVPQALGNRTLLSYYECDRCNEYFGGGIENDLGNWTKPTRTMSRIRGQSGVPTLKGKGQDNWRIEVPDNNFAIKGKELDIPYNVDLERKSIAFNLPRDPYTPAAVMKAFFRIGLTLLPDEELKHFEDMMDWVRNPDHSVRMLKNLMFYRTFHPGPMRNDFLSAILLRRKRDEDDCPYMFFMLAYGSEVYQLPMPSRSRDAHIAGKPITSHLFPSPGTDDWETYGPRLSVP